MGATTNGPVRLFQPEELTVVREDFQCYFVLPGKPPIPVFNGKRFGSAMPFSEGLAAVSDEDGHLHEDGDGGGKWYHINEAGEPAYLLRFNLVQSFSEGLAVVTRQTGKWLSKCFYIRPDGSFPFHQFFDEAGSFCKGRARVRVGNDWWDIAPDGTRISEISPCDRFDLFGRGVLVAGVD